MDENTFLIVCALIGLIQIILVLSIVHISGKVDEICNEIKNMNEKTNDKLSKVMYSLGKKD